MDTTPPPPPPAYGALIEKARKAARISVQAAADRAGISKATWIDAARGYRKRGGTREAVDPKPETIARMAHAVAGITPRRLAEEGSRPDAAEVLAEIQRPPPAPEGTTGGHPGTGIPAQDDDDIRSDLYAALAKVNRPLKEQVLTEILDRTRQWHAEGGTGNPPPQALTSDPVEQAILEVSGWDLDGKAEEIAGYRARREQAGGTDSAQAG